MQLNDIIFKHPIHGYCRANITIAAGIIDEIKIVDASISNFDHADYYVTAGFVNSHLHPNQLFDRRLLDELSIGELLNQMHTDHPKNDEDRYSQALFVLMDAIKSGATSIYAVASKPLPVIEAFKTFGIKGAVTCFYNDLWEGYGNPPTISLHQSIEQQFSSAYAERTPKIDIHIGSASIASASNELLLLIDKLAKRFSTKVNIHVSEGIESVRSCFRSRRTTPIRLLQQLGVLSKHWNLIHAVNIDEEEIALISKNGANIIHCPVTNAKTGVGVAPIKALLKAGVTIGLGSDACSNNNTNNILNEAYIASLLQSVIHLDPQVLTVETLMQWLTVNGHKILGTGQRGLIEVGEPADLVLWSLDDNAFVPQPYGNFDSALIYNAPDVKPHTVLIDGRIVVEGYQFNLIPEGVIRKRANERCMQLNSTKKRG